MDRQEGKTGTAAQVSPRAFTVGEFCEAHRISRALYYILQRENRAPASMKVGRRRVISVEAAEAWRRQMEVA
jgi:hypothetical protein